MPYVRRLIDDELDELLPDLAAIAIDGAKGVGKTATASRRAATVIALDDPARLAVIQADLSTAVEAPKPVLIDEWQLHPPTWDRVRRAVDASASGGQFLLTGSAAPPASARIHSGAGRIVSLRMRPMALCERGLPVPTVSFRAVVAGGAAIQGATSVSLRDYVDEILASGFPGIRGLPPRARDVALGSYLSRALDRDVEEAGAVVRRPQALRSWLTSYAAATSTATSYNRILDAATPGEADKPDRRTVTGYREALERMWLLDPLPAWWPTSSPLRRLAQAPKHHLADPALAASLLNVTHDMLLAGRGPVTPTPGPFIGPLFESLATLTVRSIAGSLSAIVSHFRTQNGDREVDLIVEGRGDAVVAIEVKLASTVGDVDVRHLNWLHGRLGDRLVDRLVLTTGPFAYRRADGVGVVPLALLGP